MKASSVIISSVRRARHTLHEASLPSLTTFLCALCMITCDLRLGRVSILMLGRSLISATTAKKLKISIDLSFSAHHRQCTFTLSRYSNFVQCIRIRLQTRVCKNTYAIAKIFFYSDEHMSTNFIQMRCSVRTLLAHC